MLQCFDWFYMSSSLWMAYTAIFQKHYLDKYIWPLPHGFSLEIRLESTKQINQSCLILTFSTCGRFRVVYIIQKEIQHDSYVTRANMHEVDEQWFTVSYHISWTCGMKTSVLLSECHRRTLSVSIIYYIGTENRQMWFHLTRDATSINHVHTMVNWVAEIFNNNYSLKT